MTQAMIDAGFVAGLESIAWFSRCGRPVEAALPFPVVQVVDASEALRCCADPAWEDLTLEACNRLTVFLFERHRDAYQHWNTIATAARDEILAPLTERVWQPFAARFEQGRILVDCASWDVGAAVMEHAYDLPRRPRFFLDLLEVYRAGHVPCGWSGRWPDGALQVW